jgi:hypothetical protein
MKTFRHLWQYVAELFLEWEIFQMKVVAKIKAHVLCSITFWRKSYRLWDISKNMVETERLQMTKKRGALNAG